MSTGLKFFETNAEALYKIFISKLESLTGEKMFEGDERLIYAQSLLTAIVALFNSFNEGAKARLLKYAFGEILDAIGEFKNCARLPASKASCKMRFIMNTTKNESVLIPAGTTVTTDGSLNFLTKEAAYIPAGQLWVIVEAEAEKGGAKYNGIPTGAITTIVGNVPYITGCTNQSATAGGDDGEPYPYGWSRSALQQESEGGRPFPHRHRKTHDAP